MKISFKTIFLSILGILIPSALLVHASGESRLILSIILVMLVVSLSVRLNELASYNKSTKQKLENAISDLNQANQKLIDIGYPRYENLQDMVLKKEDELESVQKRITGYSIELSTYESEIHKLLDEKNAIEKKLSSQTKKFNQIKELYQSIRYSLENYRSSTIDTIEYYDMNLIDSLSPNVILKLHHMDIKDLRQAFKDNDKIITQVLNQYESKYTTKTNQTIYQLLVIALKAELQNILYNLKYAKLDIAIKDVQAITSKYLKLAGSGNQTILPTLTKFIGEIEYLFINAVKIEYNYYVKREQQKQEQIALKEKMRQDAEERKALEAESKKIEREEAKFISEIEKLQSTVATTTNDTELQALNTRILELESQLSDIIIKKEEITKLQNGKAGNVYIISNLGSFGKDVFKIGMTRRLEPQDRVNELGSASVPFKFDVHSFIFSEDAVNLENTLHKKLNSNRVNKVNLRKEFFKVPIEELETLVFQIDPTASFNKTMIAEEYNQSLSTSEVYDTSADFYDEDELE